MKALKGLKINALITAILYVIAGLLFILFPTVIDSAIPLILIGVLVILGLVYVIDYFRTWDIEYRSNGLAIGILMLFGAFFLFLQRDVIMDAVPVLLGFGVVISGTIKLQNAIVLAKARDRLWIAVMVMSAISFVLGAVLIANPFGTKIVLITVVGVGLLLSGLSDLVIIFLMSRRVDEIKKTGRRVYASVEGKKPAAPVNPDTDNK